MSNLDLAELKEKLSQANGALSDILLL